jgi:hypothetical protein
LVGNAQGSQPARKLEDATIALFKASDNPARDRHRLADPLSHAVAWHKTRRGQELCARLAEALAGNAFASAIAACHELVAHEADCAANKQGKWGE